MLLFASLAMLVYFADHLAHSIQVDAIGKRVEHDTLAVVHGRLGRRRGTGPTPPGVGGAAARPASGYVQAVHPDRLLPLRQPARRARCGCGSGSANTSSPARCWPGCGRDRRTIRRPTRRPSSTVLDRAVRVGFERTLEQDAALGIRQLVDMACKALSPAVNDPYTAVQAVDHLSVIFCALAVRPLGDDVAADPSGPGMVIVPGRRFGDYLATMCGLIRRYGSGEPTVSLALLRLLDDCAAVLPDDPARWAAIGEQAELILADATRETAQPADLTPVVAAATELSRQVARHDTVLDRRAAR